MELSLNSATAAWQSLPPRDQILGSLNTAELFSDRVADLRAMFSAMQAEQPPCSHCADPGHALAHCPRRQEYTGETIQQLEANFMNGVIPFNIPNYVVDGIPNYVVDGWLLQEDTVRTLLRTLDKLIKLRSRISRSSLIPHPSSLPAGC